MPNSPFLKVGCCVITVTGTRTPRSVEDLPATVTVFLTWRIWNSTGWSTCGILLRYEPGVSVRNDLRYGLQDVNIRGIEGNRILFQLDGIRLPERFEFGPFNIGRGGLCGLRHPQHRRSIARAGFHPLWQRCPGGA